MTFGRMADSSIQDRILPYQRLTNRLFGVTKIVVSDRADNLKFEGNEEA